jgi:hypothetical protein
VDGQDVAKFEDEQNEQPIVDVKKSDDEICQIKKPIQVETENHVDALLQLEESKYQTIEGELLSAVTHQSSEEKELCVAWPVAVEKQSKSRSESKPEAEDKDPVACRGPCRQAVALC